jgi:hypothetical protein
MFDFHSHPMNHPVFPLFPSDLTDLTCDHDGPASGVSDSMCSFNFTRKQGPITKQVSKVQEHNLKSQLTGLRNSRRFRPPCHCSLHPLPHPLSRNSIQIAALQVQNALEALCAAMFDDTCLRLLELHALIAL